MTHELHIIDEDGRYVQGGMFTSARAAETAGDARWSGDNEYIVLECEQGAQRRRRKKPHAPRRGGRQLRGMRR